MINTNGQAEVKPFKVGELLTDNADDNPEPSSSQSEPACVETRRKVCIRCGKEIPIGKYKNAVYCSQKCCVANASYNWRVKKGLIKKPGVGSGGNQFGTDNHMYKNGIGDFSERAFAHYGRQCNRCGSVRYLLIHHQDHDRTHNQLDNLEVLCKACHQKHHETRDSFGRYAQRDSPSVKETS